METQQRYQLACSKERSSLKKFSLSEKYIFLSVCRDLPLTHRGWDYWKWYINAALYKNNGKRKLSIKNLSKFVIKQDDQSEMTEAELLFTFVITEHNLKLSWVR